MSAEQKDFYITTAISYSNGDPHLGHAYEAIATDVIARYKRLCGFHVHFLTGMDEHGQKVEKTALQHGISPQDFVDGIADKFQAMLGLLNISNDDFIRTTQVRHKKTSQALWQRLEEAGDIYLGNYAGWYSVRDEAFFGEDELSENEQGEKIAPSGAPVTWVEEPSYFFKLSAYTAKLLRYYEQNPDFIRPEFRRNEIMEFVKRGLTDLSISRASFKWGIKVPHDDDHIMYVWLDALTNYISALDAPDLNNSEGHPPLYQQFWPADYHIIGKDIMRFHTIYWPAFLMSAGLPIPKHVFGHGFININGIKMSKSLGNVVTPNDLIDMFGLDQLRYFLMREVPFGQDGSFSRESMILRMNSDLANDLGNLAMRTLSMIHKNCDGIMPKLGDMDEKDKQLLDMAYGLPQRIDGLMAQLQIHRALEGIWRLIGQANRYIDDKAPWALRKTDINAMAHVLAVVCETLRVIGILTLMVTPHASQKLLNQLGIPNDKRKIADIKDNSLPCGEALPKPEGIFPRYVEEKQG